MAAVTALFIYSLRKHRLDDYHGRYRVWLAWPPPALSQVCWKAAAWRRWLASFADRRAPWAVRFDIVWPAAIAVLVAAICIRLAIEIRRCGPAMTALSFAAIGFAFAAAATWGWPVEISQSATPLWARGSWLAGYVLLRLSFVLFGRRVQLEVSGAAARPAKPKRKKTTAAADTKAVEPAPRKPALKLRTDLDPVAPAASAPVRTSEAKPESVPMKANPEPAKPHLSRAERRKLKQQRRMAS